MNIEIRTLFPFLKCCETPRTEHNFASAVRKRPFASDYFSLLSDLSKTLYHFLCCNFFFLRKKYTQKIQRSKISSMILLLFFIFQGTISSFYDHVIWTKITIKQKNGRYELNDASVANSKSCRFLQFWWFDDYLTKVRQMKVYAFSLFKTVYLSFFLLWL